VSRAFSITVNPDFAQAEADEQQVNLTQVGNARRDA
jgi:hypothetical protein